VGLQPGGLPPSLPPDLIRGDLIRGAGRGYRARTADARGATRKTMIPAFARIALARKLLVALWQLVTTGEVPRGVILRAAV